MKKLVSLMLSLVMVLALIPFSSFTVFAAVDDWDGTVSVFEEGSGTEDDPYLITSAEELAYFAQTVRSGYSYSGEYIKLTTNVALNDELFALNPDTGLVKVTDGIHIAYLGTGIAGDSSGANTVFDITASEVGQWYVSENSTEFGAYGGIINQWLGIGELSSEFFAGIFDGGNHFVSGLYNNINSKEAGLFGSVGGEAVVKNISVVHSYLNGTYCGGIVGYASSVSVENCYSDSSVLTGDYVGGIVGYIGSEKLSVYSLSKIDNCFNNSYVKSNHTGGGIVGKVEYDIRKCHDYPSISISNSCNTAYIYGSEYAGGIIGACIGSRAWKYNGSNYTTTYYLVLEFSLRDSYNSGNVAGKSAAGVVAKISDFIFSLSCCYNIGEVKGSSSADGILYRDSSCNGSTINCYYRMGCATYGSTISQSSGALTVSSLKKQTSYEGFDFDTIWEMDTESQYVYPTLRGVSYIYANTCKHEYADLVKEPSCNEFGYTTYVCFICHTSYTDSYVSALGHDYTSSVTAPTCTEEGYTTHTCTVCGDTYNDTTVKANGHITDETLDCTTAKVCSICGIVVEAAKGHNYVATVVDPTCVEQGYTLHSCSECGSSYKEAYVRAKGHTLGDEADCENDQICIVCEKVLVKAYGHSGEGDWKYDEEMHWRSCSCGEDVDVDFHDFEWVVTSEPDVGVPGEQEYTCKTCGYVSETEEIPALEPEILLGDVNGNGALDTMDYTLLKRIYFGIYNTSNIDAGDINGNGGLDTMDYTLLKRVYFGIYQI